ncbi:MAG TPA: VWA domain-containing protein [Thermoanaerobaculia bacterium]|jgi:VWFA-related protein|nr:VWA domain-containing protein [Thermoanaerobaculia bacterium]
MRSTQRFLIVCGLLLSIGVAARTGAQMRKPGDPLPKDPAEQQKEPEPFIDIVNVSVVNVDAYVTDKKGQPVTGLSKDDFQILENGRPVEITNFYAVNAGKSVVVDEEPAPAAAAPGAAPAPAAPAAAGPPQASRTPEDQRLRLVIYIDNFNLRPFNRNRVMRELRAFIGHNLAKDDQLMLVTYDRELHVRRTFTSDPSLIASALSDLEKISAQGVHADSERRDALQRIQDSQSAAEAESIAHTYAESTYNDLSFSVDGLKKLVDSLAGMPGRKAVLYVSDGLQMIAGQDVFYAVQNKYGEQSTSLTQTLEFDVSRRLTELTAQANANRITFYTIDAAGLRVYESTTAENQGPGPTQPGLTQLVDSVRFSNLQSTLQLMAEKTGGFAIINTNVVLPQLEKIGRDFNTYYSLGYTPPHYGDGRYYKIEVKVKNRKDLLVRHREGYRDKSTDARMSDGTLAALNFPFEENPLGVSVEFGQAKPREDGYFLVPVNVRIPLGKLVLVPREKSDDAKVRLFIAALDSNGGTSDVQQAPVPISIPKAEVETAKNKYFVYSVTLLMRSGDQRVSVGVRDDVGAQASFVSRGVRVGR